jgi:methylated-DNA-[protein]-cysteine S-methyltransferase
MTLKATLREHLVEGNLEEIAEMARGRRKVLGSLLALTFDPDPEVVWRAVEAQGMGAEALSSESPSYVREHVRRLFWLITEESGACFWRAPECMAECGARMPRLLASHVSIAFHLIETLEVEDLEHFRPGALWAVGRLVDVVADDELSGVLPLVVQALDEKNPQSRGMAVWCLGRVGEIGVLADNPHVLEDEGPVEIYRNRSLEETTVGRLARQIQDEAMAEAG